MGATTIENPHLPYSDVVPGGSLERVSAIVIEGSNENVIDHNGFEIALSPIGDPDLHEPQTVIPLIFTVNYDTHRVILKYFHPVAGMQVIKDDNLSLWPSLMRDASSFQIIVQVSTVELRVDVGNEQFGTINPLPCNLDIVTHLIIDNARSHGHLAVSMISIYDTSGTDSALQGKAGVAQRAVAKK